MHMNSTTQDNNNNILLLHKLEFKSFNAGKIYEIDWPRKSAKFVHESVDWPLHLEGFRNGTPGDNTVLFWKA